MIMRSITLGLTLAGFFASSNLVNSAEFKKFTQAAFEQAKKSGNPVLVEVHADWCPTCKAQKPAVQEIGNADKFKNLIVLEADFDTQKDVLKPLNVQIQSTLIMYKGLNETGRSAGDSNKKSIITLLETGL